jgi:electron transport complex protein RnfG
MYKLKYFIAQSWLLIVSSFFFGLLIALTNAAWSPRIERNKVEKLNRLMTSLLPAAQKFDEAADIEFQTPKGEKRVVKIYKAVSENAQSPGWAFICYGAGFADKIELVVAVDAAFVKLAGFFVLSSNETPGFGDRIKQSFYRDQFVNAPAGNLKLVKTGDPQKIDVQIVAITGATVSSDAVVNIINNSLIPIKNQMVEKELITDVK